MSHHFASPFIKGGLGSLFTLLGLADEYKWMDLAKSKESDGMNGLALWNFCHQEKNMQLASPLVQGDRISLGESYMADLKICSMKHRFSLRQLIPNWMKHRLLTKLSYQWSCPANFQSETRVVKIYEKNVLYFFLWVCDIFLQRMSQ